MPDPLRYTRSLSAFVIVTFLLFIPATIHAAVPVLTSVNPGNGSLGQNVAVTITGTGFLAGGAFVNVGGNGVGVSSLNVVSDTQINATFLIATGAGLNGHQVTVVTTGGISNIFTFNVL